MTTEHDTDRLAEIRARLVELTDGPWIAEYSGETEHCVIPHDAHSTREALALVRGYYATADAEFIAHAREDIPFLLDQLEQLYTWHGLMRILDRHWPESVFPTLEDDVDRDAGPRIVSLLRWVDQLRAELAGAERARKAWIEAVDAELVDVKADLEHERGLSRRLASEGMVMATAIQRVRDLQPTTGPESCSTYGLGIQDGWDKALAAVVRALDGEVPDGS